MIFFGLMLLALLANTFFYAHSSIRYNRNCFYTEQRGEPDVIDSIIFSKAIFITSAHIAATPITLLIADRDTLTAWKTWIIHKIARRLTTIKEELDSINDTSEHYS